MEFADTLKLLGEKTSPKHLLGCLSRESPTGQKPTESHKRKRLARSGETQSNNDYTQTTASGKVLTNPSSTVPSLVSRGTTATKPQPWSKSSGHVMRTSCQASSGTLKTSVWRGSRREMTTHSRERERAEGVLPVAVPEVRAQVHEGRLQCEEPLPRRRLRQRAARKHNGRSVGG